jgi:aspartate racemase
MIRAPRTFTDRPADKVVGVLGGMGPHATADFLAQIVKLTPAEKDWNHLHVVVENNPRMPSRTRAYLFGEESPVPYLVDGAMRLIGMGAELIGVPCNSATYFLDDVREAVGAGVPVRDPVAATSVAVLAAGVTRPVVLGGDVTHRARLYQGALEPRGVVPMAVTDEEQLEVMRLIGLLKRLETRDDVARRVETLVRAAAGRGADAVILGCTEFGLVADALTVDVPVFDSNALLANELVTMARS